MKILGHDYAKGIFTSSSQPIGSTVVKKISASQRRVQAQRGEGLSPVAQAKGQTTRRELLAWAFSDAAGAKYRLERLDFAKNITAADRTFQWLFRLPRLFSAPIVGAIFLVDCFKALQWLHTPIFVPNGVSLSAYSAEMVGANLPAGLKRPDLMALLPHELYDKIFMSMMLNKNDDVTFNEHGPVKPGINPLRNAQLSGLGYRWHAVLKQNRYWAPYVASVDQNLNPSASEVKDRYLEELNGSSLATQERVRRLYGPIYNYEQCSLGPIFSTNRLIALAAVQTDGRYWNFLSDALQSDKNIFELAYTNHQFNQEHFHTRPNGAGSITAEFLLSILRRSRDAHAWTSLSAEDKNNVRTVHDRIKGCDTAWRLKTYIHDELLRDQDFTRQWVQTFPLAVFDLPDSVGRSRRIASAAETSWPAIRALACDERGRLSRIKYSAALQAN